MPQGEGTFPVDPSEILSLTWTTGPLAGSAITSSVRFDDWGQTLSVRAPSLEMECHQAGARQRVALQDFALRDPDPAAYRCVPEGGGPETALQILPGRAYSYAGVTGAYTVDIMGDQDEDFSSVEFTTGALAGLRALYSHNRDTGLRRLGIYGGGDVDCVSLGPPLAKPRFGPGRAPRAPAPGLRLSGLYASYEIDVIGLCGGLCWEFRSFTPDGRVYTREPETGPTDAACGHLLPNGLPVCETYRVRGGRIRIGDEEPASLRRSGRRLVIDGDVYRPVESVKGLRLRGTYRSFSYVPSGGTTSGVASGVTIAFTPAGRFTREGFAGATFFPPEGTSVVAVGSTASAGTYRVTGSNTMLFRFADGTTRRAFVFLPDRTARGGRPKSIHLAGGDYLPR